MAQLAVFTNAFWHTFVENLLKGPANVTEVLFMKKMI